MKSSGDINKPILKGSSLPKLRLNSKTSEDSAVGAAFSLSLAAGFSTSVAVLCHELPHEVGDFALLLSQGMSVRTAIFYNVVSSVFAVFGLFAGLLLGSQEGLSSWLLSATVGVFL